MPRITLLVGEETYLREQALMDIRRECIPDGMQGLCHHVFRKPSITDCIDAVGQTMMVLAGTPLIEIHDFSPLMKTVKESDKKQLNTLKEVLTDLPDDRQIVFVSDKLNGKFAFPKWLGKQTFVSKQEFKLFAFYETEKAVALLMQTAKKEQYQLQADAAQLLVESYGVALGPLMNEVRKLSIYAAGRPISRMDVLTLSNHSENAFKMLSDWIHQRHPVEMLAMLHEILQKDSPMRLLGLLNGQLDYLFQLCDMCHRGTSTDAAAERLKKHPYKAKMDWQEYRSVPITRLKALWQGVLRAEWQVKQGLLSDRVSLETLLAL